MNKKICNLLCLITLSLCLFSCKYSLSSNNNITSGECSIGFVLTDSNGTARTAIPSFVWGDFEYTLTADVTIDNVTTNNVLLVEKKPFANFDNGNRLALKPGSYVFTLTGYNGTTAVIKGVSATINLVDGYVPVTFRMYALTGSKGSAQITVNLPKDNIIASAKASVVTTLNDKGSLAPLTITDGVDKRTVVYTKTDLPSGTTQYARLFFYDEKGKEIASIFESLIIVGGKTSYAERTVTADSYHRYTVAVTLKKDNAQWSDYNSITVTDAAGTSYTLTKTGEGTYAGDIPEGDYKISFGTEATNAGFTAGSVIEPVEFGTVQLPSSGGIVVTPVANAGGVTGENNTYIVPKDKPFQATVTVKEGYDVTGGTVTVAGQQVASGSTVTIPANTTEVTVSGATAHEYTITYEIDGSKMHWQNENYPKKYTVENRSSIILPTYSDIKRDNEGQTTFDLDGWKLKGTDTVFARIPDTFAKDITLEPIWKTGVQIEVKQETISEDCTINGTIFACGYSLLIKWKNDDPATGVTHVYYDYNGNGEIDGDDKQVTNSSLVDNNFNNFVLKADSGSESNTPASDFTFTMKGGQIASLVGLGKEKANISTVNISGTSILGDKKNIGIDLTSLTNECVNITGQMSGEYSITLLSGNKFNAKKTTVIAYIDNPEYAQMSKFNCLYKESKEELEIGIQNSGNKKVIYLSNPESIALPDSELEGGVIWINPEINGQTQFTLGDSTKIQIPCSVFSLSVTGGKFVLQETATLCDENGKTIETMDLARNYSSGYSTNLETGKQYSYIHMFSKENRITAESVTSFLKTIKFIKNNQNDPITLSVNLETMPYEYISAMKSKGSSFDYYDGSFYLGVTKSSSINWVDSYNEAKATVFNGLNGYLITITSDVENNYINERMGLGKAWTGGSRLVNSNGFDANGFKSSSYKTSNSSWKWQCGPEAGAEYWSTKTYSNGSGQTSYYTNWDPRSQLAGKEPNNSPGFGNSSSEETCMHYLSDGLWNDYMYNNSEVKSYIVEFRPYSSGYGVQKANYPAISNTKAY